MAEMDKDREVLLKTLGSFAIYRPSLHSTNQLRRTDYISLKASHKALIPDYLKKLEAVDDAVDLNSDLVETMLETGSLALLSEPWTAKSGTTPSSEDVDKVRSAVKQLVRDWSAEGSHERKLTYEPILRILEDEYDSSDSSTQRSRISVLTPGCGLGRLSFEIARLGFNSVGNEFSYHMLIASNYLLNCTSRVGQHKIAPFIHSLSNHESDGDLLRRIEIPDVVPAEVLSNAHFSMAAGEFVECFGDDSSASTFDCIVTCFFLDTAHNIVEYVETIRNLLKDGGLWINLGPCLWHFEHGQNRHGKSAFDEDGSFVGSIELSMDELLKLITKMGFTLEKNKSITTPYMENNRSMLKHTYQARLFTARLRKK